MHQCHTYQKKSTHCEGSRTFIHSLIFHRSADCLVFLSSAAILLGSIFVAPRSSALSYQSTIKPQFTINDTLTVTVSSADIYINDLAPGQSDISNIVDITVLTNNAYGYTLTSTAGNGDTYKDTNLTNTLDGTKTFTSLATTDSIASPTSFDDSEWGYSFSTDAQATWSNYSGLPYYGNTGATLLAKDTQSAATGDVVNFKIAAKSSDVQTAGTYNNVINFMATGNPIPVTLFNISTMQEMTSSVCSATTTPASSATTFDTTGEHAGDTSFVPRTTLTDTRDGSTYLVSKLADGHCWMLDNLALGRVQLTPNDTNIESNYIFPAEATTWANTYTEAKINTESNNVIPQGEDPLKKEAQDGQWKVGTYYNYCAATAGTYCPAEGTSTESSTQDICPKGWRLPSGGPGGEFLALYTAYGSNYNNFRTSFRLPLSGSYYSAQAHDQGNFGFWRSSTFYDGNSMYTLFANTSGIGPQYTNGRYDGFSVRCAAK